MIMYWQSRSPAQDKEGGDDEEGDAEKNADYDDDEEYVGVDKWTAFIVLWTLLLQH